MAPQILTLLPVFALILAAEFVNGWTDAPNAIATVVSTRVLSPGRAVIMAAVLNVAGACSGTAVAFTIGTGIVKPEAINLTAIGAAMVGIVIWSTVAWWFGLPTSESHGLLAGLAGAGFATGGFSTLAWSGWKKVFIGLGFSTFLGFFLGLLVTTVIYRTMKGASPEFLRKVFGKLQIFSSAFMAFSHGSNDGQKFMGMMTLSLYLTGFLKVFKVPLWVIFLCGVTMAVGTAFGGWKIIKTMGVRLTKLQPVHGFAAETSAACAIELASRLGIPLSTTHTINTAIMGVGATRRFSAVRWGVGGEIVAAWILTFPVCGLIAYTVTKLSMLIF
jgi:PiT family inorganic phosphate transporter